ncbi:MAG: transcription termination/antitermination protein NusA [Selenomonadaceae bacterium]|nr:transcription termination/antitermination protein NusA [Selenomonadaceae bacterium]
MAVRKRRGSKNEIFLLDALKDLCAEREIPPEVMFNAIEAALIFACKKTSGADKNIAVDIDREKGTFRVMELRDVVKKVTNPEREISLNDARRINSQYNVGDVVKKEIPAVDFGRIAAQAAKQVVTQKIREAERIVVYDEFTERANDVVSGTVLRIEDNGDLVLSIGKTEAVIETEAQLPQDKFNVGDRVRGYVSEVRRMGKGPQVYLSRTHPNFLRRLLEMEVPEIQEGLILIKSVVRDPGARAKIAVTSKDKNIDAIGSCVGEHGIRIQAVVDELGDEKIDIVLWDEDPAKFVSNALSPSKVMRIAVNELDKIARVVVPDNQLSLAIGREGQNARLAARLTGWKIDIKSKSQAQDEVFDSDYRVSKVQGAKFFSSLVKQKPPKPMKGKGKNKLKKSADENSNAEVLNVENPADENLGAQNTVVEENSGVEVPSVDNSTVEVHNAEENVSNENSVAEKPNAEVSEANNSNVEPKDEV